MFASKSPRFQLLVLAGLTTFIATACSTVTPPSAELATRAVESDVQAISADVQALKSEQGLLFEQLEELRLGHSTAEGDEGSAALAANEGVANFDERVRAIGSRLTELERRQGTNADQLRADLGKLKTAVETLARALAIPTDATVLSSQGEAVYVVKSGDTLERISRQLGVSVDSLRETNDIKGDLIIPDQRIAIPPKPGQRATGH